MSKFHKPLAARLGAIHVSIAQGSSGLWSVMAWGSGNSPEMVQDPRTYGEAVAGAQAFAFRVGGVLALPIETGHIDVLREPGGTLEVLQISRSENSASSLARFGADERDAAIAFALRKLPFYAPCRLGRIDE